MMEFMCFLHRADDGLVGRKHIFAFTDMLLRPEQIFERPCPFVASVKKTFHPTLSQSCSHARHAFSASQLPSGCRRWNVFHCHFISAHSRCFILLFAKYLSTYFPSFTLVHDPQVARLEMSLQHFDSNLIAGL